MIKHKLFIIGSGHDPKPDLQDFQVLHIMYKLDTVKTNDETDQIQEYATTGIKVAILEPWDVENRIEGLQVTNEILEQWVSESINIEKVKQTNIANLKPVQTST
jgi:hypothetical protein